MIDGAIAAVTGNGTDRGNRFPSTTPVPVWYLPRELERMHSPQLDTPQPKTIALVGAGRVGGSLHQALLDAGLDARLGTRDSLDEALDGAELALLCVPDERISEVCARVVPGHPSLRHVGHTSGVSTLDVLAPATDAGLGVLSIHPLQTIPTPRTALTNSPAAVAGSSPDALEIAKSVASAAGLQPFEVPENARAAYHAAASIASNFLIALEESAAGLLERAGVADARELLSPLVLRTAANWAEAGGETLTGPIARGDQETVQRHREAIAEFDPELSELYDVLAARTRATADGRAFSEGWTP